MTASEAMQHASLRASALATGRAVWPHGEATGACQAARDLSCVRMRGYDCVQRKSPLAALRLTRPRAKLKGKDGAYPTGRADRAAVLARGGREQAQRPVLSSQLERPFPVPQGTAGHFPCYECVPEPRQHSFSVRHARSPGTVDTFYHRRRVDIFV